ncbi:AIM24 family protein [Rhizobium leguminosarum]|uniref:AIM24 family protein n=1 Tax=Rhizobium leguminosarum TaxID=384 RepID=UPI003ECEA958
MAFLDSLSTGTALSTDAASKFPGVVHDEMERFRPGDIDEGHACRNANFRVLRARISLGGLCRSIISAVEEGAQAAFNRAQANTVARAKVKAEKFNADATTAAAEARAAGPETIHEMFDDLRTTAKYLFLLSGILSYVSYVLLAAGIIGGLNLVLGRLLFDSVHSPRFGPRSALGFRLERSTAAPSAISFSTHHQINLATDPVTSGIATDWYVVLQAMRVGAGTHMRTSVPKPFSLFFSRFAAGKYLMTRITVDSVVPAVQHPTISSPGDLKLVLIDLAQGQELVFRMSDLLAFSSSVGLSSVYTAHVATHLLGLGSFYSVATGPGYVVLTSEGQQTRALTRNLSVPPVSLLCWDRRTEFTLGQEMSFSGMWFNDPSVVGNSVSGTAIIDEGRASGPGLLRHIWRVARYLFMPF